MSEANVAVVRAVYDAWAAGRSVGAFIDENVEYVNPPDAVEPGVRFGRRAFAEIRSSYDDVRIEPQEYSDTQGDDVVVIAQMLGRGRGERPRRRLAAWLRLDDSRWSGGSLPLVQPARERSRR
jgi:hypothetical protein